MSTNYVNAAQSEVLYLASRGYGYIFRQQRQAKKDRNGALLSQCFTALRLLESQDGPGCERCDLPLKYHHEELRDDYEVLICPLREIREKPIYLDHFGLSGCADLEVSEENLDLGEYAPCENCGHDVPLADAFLAAGGYSSIPEWAEDSDYRWIAGSWVTEDLRPVDIEEALEGAIESALSDG